MDPMNLDEVASSNGAPYSDALHTHWYFGPAARPDSRNLSADDVPERRSGKPSEE